jgi:dipeptidyl aminopeptidase/acylaminoacyl peptidase
MHDIERYLNIQAAYGTTLSPSGRLAFLMNTTGTSQVWTLDKPDAWPDQRTFYDESVSFCSYSPTQEHLVFGMDEGGDENTQLYRLDADDTVTDLTGHSEARHHWGGWSESGDRFAFTSNRRDSAVFDVYVQRWDGTPTDADLIFEGDGIVSVGGFSPDGSTLVMSEVHNNFDMDVYVLDIESGEQTHLTPHEGDIRYAGLEWGSDGGLYLTTDQESDRLYLARLDIDGEVTPVVKDEQWNIDGVSVHSASDRLVYSRNVDGYTELTVADIDAPGKLTETAAPELPDGVAGGISWGPGGESFVLSASGSTSNTNVYRFDDTGTKQWTHASTAGIDPASFAASTLVHIESFDNLSVPGYLSLPSEIPDGGAAVVVDVHGGPESQRRPSFGSLTQYFLANGYAVFEPNIRGSTGYGRQYTHLDDVKKRMDSIADLNACAEWLAAHEATDGDRLIIKGGSYGGFATLAALTEYPDRWAAGVDIVGIANFVTFLENTADWRRENREAEYGSLAEHREFLKSISPVHRANSIRAPLFVVHGANDPRVPLGEAEQIVGATSKHVPTELLVYDDEGHGLSKRENRIEAYTEMVAFLDQHV